MPRFQSDPGTTGLSCAEGVVSLDQSAGLGADTLAA